MANKIFVILLLTFCANVYAQNENLQTSVSKFLIECYNSTYFVIKDNKLPMTLNSFLDIIRKVEDGKDIMDYKELAQYMHSRFRQDGIIRAKMAGSTGGIEGALLYSPRSWTNDKFKVVAKLLPGDGKSFPNDTLTRLERCSLHSMLSSSIEIGQRGDETYVCNTLGKYQIRRSKRGLKKRAVPNDVEVMDPSLLSEEKGNMKKLKEPNPDAERFGNYEEPKSDCPVENGVIKTPWGAVSAGPLLAGIVAGAYPQQNIKIDNIVTDRPTTNLADIDNLWAVTLAGDLAEAALYIAEDTDSTSKEVKSVGCSGNFNSTDSPHWYFLQKNTDLYLTDAEIRGGIDGLVIGKILRTKLSNVPSLKLSQIIDMYYSNVGIINNDQDKIMACARQNNFVGFSQTKEIMEQTKSIAYVLDKNVRLRISLNENNILELANQAVNLLQTYTPNLNDAQCMTYSVQPDLSDVATNLIMAVDFSWPYKEIYEIIPKILNQMAINKYNGNYTIINAMDGSMIVNSSSMINDFYQNFNESTYLTMQKGFDYTRTIRSVEEVAKWYMEKDRTRQPNQIGGGRSLIGLIVSYSDATPTDYINNRMRDIINVYVPDLRFFVLTHASKDGYANVVKDESKDVVVYTSDPTAITSLTNRIKEVPRAFTNQKCGSNWVSSGVATNQIMQYIVPQGINFYRIHPNYFFNGGSIKIASADPNEYTVCYSRSNTQPRANQTAGQTGDVTCDGTAGKELTINLNDACKDKTFIHDCLPLYFSVAAPKSNEANMFTCRDPGCRFPTSMKYAITGDGLGCNSSAATILTNIFLMIAMWVLVKIQA